MRRQCPRRRSDTGIATLTTGAQCLLTAAYEDVVEVLVLVGRNAWAATVDVVVAHATPQMRIPGVRYPAHVPVIADQMSVHPQLEHPIGLAPRVHHQHVLVVLPLSSVRQRPPVALVP